MITGLLKLVPIRTRCTGLFLTLLRLITLNIFCRVVTKGKVKISIFAVFFCARVFIITIVALFNGSIFNGAGSGWS